MRIVPNRSGTQPLRNPEYFRPFSVWLNERGQSGELSAKKYGFSYCDVDGYFFADRPPEYYHFLLEVKGNGAGVFGLSQKTALLAQMASHAAADGMELRFRLWGRQTPELRVMRFLGAHLLEMDGANPAESAHMMWDSKHEIDEVTLMEILRFERDARNPGRMLGEDDSNEAAAWQRDELRRADRFLKEAE